MLGRLSTSSSIGVYHTIARGSRLSGRDLSGWSMSRTSHKVMDGPSRPIGAVGLIIVGFFWVSGGIYGNEALFQAGPPALTLPMCLFVAPMLYCVPLAFITAEMSTCLPEDGGMVAWVQHSCGSFVGGHNAYWVWVAYLLDASSYPNLAGWYSTFMFHAIFSDDDDSSDDPKDNYIVGRRFFSIGVIVLLTIFKLLGNTWLIRFSGVLVLLSLVPYILYVSLGAKHLDPSQWIEYNDSPSPEFSLLVSWVLWLYSGFMSLGTVAGQVERPARTYSIALTVLIPVVVVQTCLPLIVSLGLQPDREQYRAGYFTELAGHLAGPWLQWVFVLGSMMCLWGLFGSASLSADHSINYFMETHFPEWTHRRSRSRSWVVRSLFDPSGTGVAPFYVVMNAILACGGAQLPYAVLVTLMMVISSFSLLLFMYSFLWHRWYLPDMERSFSIPGGLPVAVAAASGPIVLALINAGLGLALKQNVTVDHWDFQRLPAVGSVGIILLGLLVQLVCKVVTRLTGEESDDLFGLDRAASSWESLPAPCRNSVEKLWDHGSVGR